MDRIEYDIQARSAGEENWTRVVGVTLDNAPRELEALRAGARQKGWTREYRVIERWISERVLGL